MRGLELLECTYSFFVHFKCLIVMVPSLEYYTCCPYHTQNTIGFHVYSGRMKLEPISHMTKYIDKSIKLFPLGP